jgi:hypothetical protein
MGRHEYTREAHKPRCEIIQMLAPRDEQHITSTLISPRLVRNVTACEVRRGKYFVVRGWFVGLAPEHRFTYLTAREM